MKLIKSYLTNNPCYKAGEKITVKGLMLHSVGINLPRAHTFAESWNKSTAGVCVHAFIDANDGKILQTLPWEYRAWHCGGSGNNTHIGIEMCEPACITYLNDYDFECRDREAAAVAVKRTYNAAVELFAMLCKKFSLDPLEDGGDGIDPLFKCAAESLAFLVCDVGVVRVERSLDLGADLGLEPRADDAADRADRAG